MKPLSIVIFGTTGMIGTGVLRECLLDPEVGRVLVIGRTPIGQTHDKLKEIVLKDLTDYSAVAADLAGLDACFFCLGVSAAGMKEADYSRITYDVTLAAARALIAQNKDMTFIYVSGAGTDSTEKGRSMWARVKGRTENALLGLGFKSAVMFRPGYIQPMHGARSKTAMYRRMYAVVAPLYPVWRLMFGKHITNTESLAKAMLEVAKRGSPKPILSTKDIELIARAAPKSASAAAS
ncbi:MAG: epimerase [Myxococcota bacterium]